MNCKQLRENIVHPVLQHLGMWSQPAEDLMLGTAAIESQMGEYIVQVGGPALGIWQVEPATHEDLWANWLKYHHDIAHKIEQWAVSFSADEMIWNLAYACAVARCVYFRRPEPMPATSDPWQLGTYYKNWYNTPLGKGTIPKFVEAYERYVR